MLVRLFRPAYRIASAVTTRSFHSATAELVNLGPNGALVTSKVPIKIGDPGEAYVLIPPAIGRALQTSGWLANRSALSNGSPKVALKYFHDTQHFAHAQESSPGYPRLVIPQPLPRQSTANVRPATLFLYGKLQTIALDGTPDEEFAELASTQELELGGALEKLKDM